MTTQTEADEILPGSGQPPDVPHRPEDEAPLEVHLLTVKVAGRREESMEYLRRVASVSELLYIDSTGVSALELNVARWVKL